jgi:PAS domain-containing protein
MSRVTDYLQGGQLDRRRSPRRRFEISAARILDTITDEVIGLDREWRFTYVNEAALQSIRRATGREHTRDDVLGKDVWGMLPVPVGSDIYQAYHEAARHQKTVNFEARSRSTHGYTERTIIRRKRG